MARLLDLRPYKIEAIVNIDNCAFGTEDWQKNKLRFITPVGTFPIQFENEKKMDEFVSVITGKYDNFPKTEAGQKQPKND